MDKGVVINEVTIDFSQLLVHGTRYAVHCETREEAEIFLSCLREKYPEKCENWKRGETHFGKYSTTCYSPCLNMGEYETLKYCNKGYYEDEGYTVIPFTALIVQPDIEESELSMDALFGGVV